MARGRDKERPAKENATSGGGSETAVDEGKDKGEGGKRRLAAIAATLEDIVYAQELLLTRVQNLTEQLADQRRLLERLAARRPAATDDAPGATAAPPASVFAGIVPELHNAQTGRLDAKRVSEAFGITLSQLSRVLGRNLSTVSKTPDAEALQDRLCAFERIATALLQLGWPLDRLRIWTRTPGPLSDGRTPGDLISEGLAVVLAQRLEDSIAAGPE
jgi:hypothetical protein